MSDVGRQISRVRREVRKRDRLLLDGRTVSYVCSCGMGVTVGLCRGVESPGEHGAGVPCPRWIPCRYCDGQARLELDSLVHHLSGITLSKPYLRVPSRRAQARLVRHDRFEAQYVDPETPQIERDEQIGDEEYWTP